MNRILFVPSVAQSEWLHEILPWLSLAELPVAGRRFIDYALESAQKFGTSVVGILDWHFSDRLSADCNNLTARGLPVIYQPGKGSVPRGLNDLDHIASPFTSPVQDGLAVEWGLCLTSHKPEEITYEEISSAECEETPVGLYLRKDGRWMRCLPQGIAVKDVRSWQRLGIAVLENPWLFTLPGYSAEKDVHLGRNVILEHGTKVEPPVILQDNTWCARNVHLNGDVVVGQRSFIGIRDNYETITRFYRERIELISYSVCHFVTLNFPHTANIHTSSKPKPAASNNAAHNHWNLSKATDWHISTNE